MSGASALLLGRGGDRADALDRLLSVRRNPADRLLGVRRDTLDGLVGQGSDAVCCRMGQRSQPFCSIVGDRPNAPRSRLGQRSQPIRCSVGKWRHLVCRRTNPIRGGFCKWPDSGGGGLREGPYSIGCGVDHRSDTISGRVDEIHGGWRNLIEGGFGAAGTLGHVSSVVRNLMLLQ